LCLFFAKLVSYVFLFWLPTFIKHNSKMIRGQFLISGPILILRGEVVP
jgi:hypothetical protein